MTASQKISYNKRNRKRAESQGAKFMLTKRQKQIFDFISKFIKDKGYSPSLDEIRRHFGLKSVSTIHEHIDTLHTKGYLKKKKNQSRGVAPLEKMSGNVEIPLLGTVAAGQPIEAIENPEIILVSKQLLSKSGKHYALKVNGDSMINEGILDGDVVIVREQKTADNGETVVAIINDNEATLKKIYKESHQIRLQPANPSLLPLFADEVEIKGKVVSIVRTIKRVPVITPKQKTKKSKYQRTTNYGWDFRGVNTKLYTHGLHQYPAMFIPQLAKRLLLSYSKEGDTICDIFCGSGTALVEAKLLGRNAYGIDLNPFAILLAKVKTTEINPTLLQKQYSILLNSIDKIKLSNVKTPNFYNIEFWFKENIIKELARIKKAILQIRNKRIKNFFMVAFSVTVRKCSNTKSGEFKLVRIPKDKLKNHKPNVLKIFKESIEKNIKGMMDYWYDVNKNVWAKPIYGDSSQNNRITNELIDCIITSPPYGDSKTTVAYGQFSRLSAQWMDIFDDPKKASGVDKELLGGRPSKNLNNNLNSKYLDKILNEIAKKDEKRARDVLSFYIGLEKCLKQAYRILKPNKYFCLVIGNRLVKQIRVPTDFIVAELSENIGFKLANIFVRNIPNKRMPLKNSPTNIAGHLEKTMSKESIIIFKKV